MLNRRIDIKNLLILIILGGLNNNGAANIISEWNSKVSEIMIKDGFSPVLASRSFMYINIAPYLILEGHKNMPICLV
jgi:hypothetical protein